MDGERILEFIAYIQEHSALWKKEDKDFINRDVRRKLLSDIGDKMGMTEEECRKKLKNLKDKMREICNKLPKTSSGQPAFHKGEQFVRWPYFKALLFMKDQFINRDANCVEDNYHTEAAASDDADDDDKDGLSTTTIHFEPPVKESVDLESLFTQQSQAHERQIGQRRKRGRIPNAKTKFTKRQAVPAVGDRSTYFDLERDHDSGGSFRKGLTTDQSQSRKPKDEWGAFAESICHDLRKITNPYLIVSVKNDINKLVGETVIKQLNMSSQVSHCSRIGNAGIGMVMAESTGQLPSTSMAEFKSEEDF